MVSRGYTPVAVHTVHTELDALVLVVRTVAHRSIRSSLLPVVAQSVALSSEHSRAAMLTLATGLAQSGPSSLA